MKNLAYVTSLILIGISIFIIIEYPNSGRMSLIAGAMTTIGFVSNIVSYLLNSKEAASQKKKY